MIEREEGLIHKNRPDLAEVKRPRSYRRNQEWIPLIEFVKNWQEEHPGRRGAGNAAGKMFGISRQRVHKILSSYSDEPLKPTGVTSLYQLAHQLEVKPRILVNLLRRGEISFGNGKINEFYMSDFPYSRVASLRRIPLSSVDIDSLKKELKISQSVEETMKYLTRSVAQRNKDIFLPILKLAHEANAGNLGQSSKIYDELTSAGFHLKRILGSKKGSWYYYAHTQEAPAIITYLQGKYQGKSKA